MKRAAIKKLVEVVQRGLNNLPIRDQIDVYSALAEVMPTKRERGHAAYISQILRAAEKSQLDFTKQLFTELKWPGHQHDGGGDGKGKR